MAEVFGEADDWKSNYKTLKAHHDGAYTKIDQGISCENRNQIEMAIQKYDEGLLLIDKALAVPIGCPSNPDPTWERACKMAEQMKRTRKEILSRLADIQAARHIPVEHRDDPDAPPSYDQAIASSSSGNTGSYALPSTGTCARPNSGIYVPPNTENYAYSSSGSSTSTSTQSSNTAPQYNSVTGNVFNSGTNLPNATQNSVTPNYPNVTPSNSNQGYPTVPESSTKAGSIYPSVPVNHWHSVPSYPVQPRAGNNQPSAHSFSVDTASSDSGKNNTSTDKGGISHSASQESLKPQPISLTELGKALESARHQISHTSAVEIFTCNNVAVCHVMQDGHVAAINQTEVLKIFLTEDEDNPHYYLQVGSWRYPLIKGVSPCVRTNYGAFVFPDLESKEKGKSIALIVPEDCIEPLTAILEDILNVEIQYGAHPGTRPPSDLPETISQHIISGGNFISNALIKGAEKVEQCLNYGTPRVIDKITPNKEPAELPSKMRSGIKVTKNVSESAAKTTGYIANKVSSATVGLGRFLSPHVKKGGTALLTRYYGCAETEAAQTMEGALTVGAGAVEGVAAVYSGLEVAGAMLGRSLADSTVQIVKHKYGQPAGEFTEDTFHTVGNALQVNTNVRSLATRRLIKNTIKQTGKQVVLQNAKDAKASEASGSGDKTEKGSTEKSKKGSK